MPATPSLLDISHHGLWLTCCAQPKQSQARLLDKNHAFQRRRLRRDTPWNLTQTLHEEASLQLASPEPSVQIFGNVSQTKMLNPHSTESLIPKNIHNPQVNRLMRAQRFPFCVQLHAVRASKLPVSLATNAALRMLAVAFLNRCQL